MGIGALIAFCSGPGQTFVFAVFIDSLIEDTGLSRTAISSLYAVGTFVSAAMVLTVSRLADRYGICWTLLGAAIGLGLACFSMSLAYGAVLVFFAFAALRALGQGSMTINGTLLVAQWFVRRRGRAMSLMHLGIPIAVAVQPPVGRLLIDSIGWREAYIALGVMVWVLTSLPRSSWCATGRRVWASIPTATTQHRPRSGLSPASRGSCRPSSPRSGSGYWRCRLRRWAWSARD